jgi:hypothetical protein
MKKLIAMIRKIFNKFIALFAIAGLSTGRNAGGCSDQQEKFSGGSPKSREPKYKQPGSHNKKPVVANCRKIWRNRHGIH